MLSLSKHFYHFAEWNCNGERQRCFDKLSMTVRYSL